ncbi:MAG: DUF1178 family protein [Betaproteobacteria bacterium]|nr:DUF1178 family protein [Betaproteobacteria bacterium]
MIVYDLQCGSGHRFEGWFASADDFASQKSRGLVNCPTCGMQTIDRVPSVTRFNSGVPEPRQPQAETKPDELAGKDPMAIAQVLYSRMLDEMLQKSEDVGRAFPEEARRIHYKEVPSRAIRGQASTEEHADLVEEGIPVLRLPIPPRDLFS